MMPVLFQQCCMVLKYLDVYTLLILKKHQKRALRFFMEVHTSTPIQAMMCDMGWTDIYIYIYIRIIMHAKILEHGYKYG